MGMYIPLKGTHLIPLANSRRAGPIDTAEVIGLTIRVRSLSNTDELIARAHELGRTRFANRQYLNHDQLEMLYGAKKEDLDAVETYAISHNLVVTQRSAIARTVKLRGTLGDALAAFPTSLAIYHHSTGTYRGRQGEISVPSQLSGVITGVFGFDTRPKHRAPTRLKRMVFSGPGGDQGYASTFFAKRYNFPSQFNGKQLDGSGQTIAIIELGGGFRMSDLQAFFKEINSPMPNIVSVAIDDQGNSPTLPSSDDREVMLDIEVAGAVVPGANLVVYFSPHRSDNKGFMDAISAAVYDFERNPGVLSISWGSPEDFVDAQSITAFHEIFAHAAHLGITICVASGDHGAADQSAFDWDQKIHVDYPASDDLILACGGTQIDSVTNQDVAWNDGTPFNLTTSDGGGWASGGGISAVFAVPDYQGNANLPLGINTGQPGRGVPDIAMSATNYFCRVDSTEGPSGGTSAVAPLMAALIARLNQAKGKNMGFINPFLYANVNRGVVRDVVLGTNGIANTINGYSSGVGWDACTGLGTPDGENILGAL